MSTPQVFQANAVVGGVETAIVVAIVDRVASLSLVELTGAVDPVNCGSKKIPDGQDPKEWATKAVAVLTEQAGWKLTGWVELEVELISEEPDDTPDWAVGPVKGFEGAYAALGCKAACGFEAAGVGYQCRENDACGRYLHPGDKAFAEVHAYYSRLRKAGKV